MNPLCAFGIYAELQCLVTTPQSTHLLRRRCVTGIAKTFSRTESRLFLIPAMLSDDFSKGFALHSVVEMLTATGQDQLARETLATIRDESIKEKATAAFLAGPQACYNNLLVSKKHELKRMNQHALGLCHKASKRKRGLRVGPSYCPLLHFMQPMHYSSLSAL